MRRCSAHAARVHAARRLARGCVAGARLGAGGEPTVTVSPRRRAGRDDRRDVATCATSDESADRTATGAGSRAWRPTDARVARCTIFSN